MTSFSHFFPCEKISLLFIACVFIPSLGSWSVQQMESTGTIFDMIRVDYMWNLLPGKVLFKFDVLDEENGATKKKLEEIISGLF